MARTRRSPITGRPLATTDGLPIGKNTKGTKHPGGRGGPQPGNDPGPNKPSKPGSKNTKGPKAGASVGVGAGVKAGVKAGTSKPNSGGSGGKGGKSGGGSKGGGGGGASYKGLGGIPGLPMKEAKKIVNKQVQAEIRKLKNQIEAEKRNKEKARSDINKDYSRTVGDLNYVFDAGNQQIAQNNKAVQDRFATENEQMQNLFNQFMGQQQQQVGTRRGDMTGELARLGIQQAGTGQFDQDAGFAQDMMGANHQNANQNLLAMQQGTASANSMLQNMMQGSQKQHLGMAANEQQRAKDNANHEFNQYLHDLKAQKRDIRAGKWSSIRELAMALQEQRFNQGLAMNQANFDNQMAINHFNLDKSQFNAQNMWQQAGMMQDQAKANQQYKQEWSKHKANNITKQFADIIKGIKDKYS